MASPQSLSALRRRAGRCGATGGLQSVHADRVSASVGTQLHVHGCHHIFSRRSWCVPVCARAGLQHGSVDVCGDRLDVLRPDRAAAVVAAGIRVDAAAVCSSRDASHCSRPRSSFCRTPDGRSVARSSGRTSRDAAARDCDRRGVRHLRVVSSRLSAAPNRCCGRKRIARAGAHGNLPFAVS